MSAYIEKQVAIDAMKQLPHEYKTQEQRARTGGIAACQMIIRNLEAADVRPVVYGRWVKVGGFFTPGGDPVWQCSECGKGRHVYGIEHGTYGADVSDGQWLACPNCMAIMRGENSG